MSDSARTRLLHYATMRFARDLDTRFAMLLRTGRLSKWYSQIGSEATTVAAGLHLRPGDALCTLHRDLGAILSVYLDPARTFPGFGFGEPDGVRPEPRELLYRLCCQLLGRGDGFSNGVERSFHYGYLAPEVGIRHIGMISHLGSMIPVAAGAAFALKQAGGDRIALNFIGDGGTSTGDFHEGLNMAAVWKLPLILIIENNRYAFSTPVSAQYAAERLSDRGLGYGIAAEHVDGNDPDAVAATMARAVARARSGGGPTLIEAMLGRMRGHSEGDDSLKMVPEDELSVYMGQDPVPAYASLLQSDGVLGNDELARIETRISELVEEAVASALEAPEPELDVAMRPALAPQAPWSGFEASQVKAQAPTTGSEGAEASEQTATSEETATSEDTVETYVEGIHQALREEMERDDAVVLSL